MPTPSHLRPSAQERGYGWSWHKVRTRYLRTHPLCVMCREAGLVVAATVVDHRIPHRGNQTLMWSEDNFQGLCASHHSSTKARIERGSAPQQVGADGWPL